MQRCRAGRKGPGRDEQEPGRYHWPGQGADGGNGHQAAVDHLQPLLPPEVLYPVLIANKNPKCCVRSARQLSLFEFWSIPCSQHPVPLDMGFILLHRFDSNKCMTVIDMHPPSAMTSPTPWNPDWHKNRPQMALPKWQISALTQKEKPQGIWKQGIRPIDAGCESRFASEFARKSFDVAFMQCQHTEMCPIDAFCEVLCVLCERGLTLGQLSCRYMPPCSWTMGLPETIAPPKNSSVPKTWKASPVVSQIHERSGD